jgi:hypothetical protein
MSTDPFLFFRVCAQIKQRGGGILALEGGSKLVECK